MIKRKLAKVRTLLVFSFAGLLSLTFTSCENDGGGENEIQVEGIYVVNEGQFGNNNGSITLMEPESGDVIPNYFEDENARTPGDVVQDLSFSQNEGYIVVNNSKKVEIVDKSTFETVDVINAISYPRQFLAINTDKGYLTNGSSADSSRGHLLVINLNDHTITDSIEVGRGPESMVKVNNKVFVTNGGGFKRDNTVDVIDAPSDEVTKTVEVGYIPTDIVKDKNNDVWVFCKGLSSYQTGGPTPSKLVKIGSDNYQTTSYDIGKISSYGNYLLAIGPNEETLYFAGEKGIYEMKVSGSEVPVEPVISRIPYGLDVNPENGNIYCLTANFETRGYAYRYNSDYQLKDSTQVGYNPNAVVFE
jgi:hypothetical protein